jgi:hypothetical protein
MNHSEGMNRTKERSLRPPAQNDKDIPEILVVLVSFTVFLNPGEAAQLEKEALLIL